MRRTVVLVVGIVVCFVVGAGTPVSANCTTAVMLDFQINPYTGSLVYNESSGGEWKWWEFGQEAWVRVQPWMSTYAMRRACIGLYSGCQNPIYELTCSGGDVWWGDWMNLPPGAFQLRLMHRDPWPCPACDIPWYPPAPGLGMNLSVTVRSAVDIDAPKRINPLARGVIPVKLLGSEDIDIYEIDVTTMRLGTNSHWERYYLLPKHDLSDDFTFNEHIEDLNSDGYMDLVLHFEKDMWFPMFCGENGGVLAGSLLDGMPFVGFDSFETVGCNPNRRLPPPWWTNPLSEQRHRHKPRLQSEEHLEDQRVD